MAVGSLSMFVPSFSPTNSSSHRNSSAVKHFLPATCSAHTEEPSRNQPLSGSPGTKNWRNAISTALAAAVVTFGCSLPANAGVVKPEVAIGSAVQLGSFEVRSVIARLNAENHMQFCAHVGVETVDATSAALVDTTEGNCIVPNIHLKQERLYEKDYWANLDASSGSLEVTASSNTEHALFDVSLLHRSNDAEEHPRVAVDLISGLVITDIDPATAKLAAGILGPSLSAFGFLFIVRIVMSWYPSLPVGEFPYVLAYAPTEPFLIVTRKVIPPLGGVDVTPVVWFGIISFLSEILVGPQGILILLSQQVG